MLLNETILAKPVLEEMSRIKLPDGVLCRVSYPICDIGQKNANTRVYEDAVWDKVESEKDLQEKLENRALFGHAEHPEQTESNLEKTSHVIFEMWRADGQEWQKFDVLDTPTGRIVDCLIRAGCRVGCSTRAEGDLEEAEDDDGNPYQRVVAETYKYVTTDFTADPSTFGSVPYDIKRNIVSEVKKLLESKLSTVNEKDFGTRILEGMKCKKVGSGIGKHRCHNCGCCSVLEEKRLSTKAEKDIPKSQIHQCNGCGKKFDDVSDVNTSNLCKKCAKLFGEKKLKNISSLITEGVIKEGTKIKYEDKSFKVDKIDEAVSLITLSPDGEDRKVAIGQGTVQVTGNPFVKVEADGTVTIIPGAEEPFEKEPGGLDGEVPEQAPEELSPCPDEGEVPEPVVEEPGNTGYEMPAIGGDEVDAVPEAKGLPPTASPHIQDGYWYDEAGDKVKVIDSTSNLLTIRSVKGKTEDIPLKHFLDKYIRHEVDEAKEDPIKVRDRVVVTAGKYKNAKGIVVGFAKDANAYTVSFDDFGAKATIFPTDLVKEAKVEVGATVKFTKDALETLVKTSKGKVGRLVDSIQFDDNELVEGKVIEIKESGITIALDDGTVVDIEDPSAVSITVTAPAPAEEIVPVEEVPEEEFPEAEEELPPKEEFESKIDEDTSRKAMLQRRVKSLKKEKVDFEKQNQRKLDRVEKELKALAAEGSGIKKESKVEDLKENWAAGNLLHDKDGKDWIIKETGGTGMTVTQPGEPGTEKFIPWEETGDYGFTKVSEVKVEEMAIAGATYINKETGDEVEILHIGLDDRTGEAAVLLASGQRYSGKEFLEKFGISRSSASREFKVKEAKSVEKEDGWHVESPDGKDLGGPYPSKIEADKRKKDVEFFAVSKESIVDEQKLSVGDVKKLFKSIDGLFAKHLTGLYGTKRQVALKGKEVGLKLSSEGEEALKSKIGEEITRVSKEDIAKELYDKSFDELTDEEKERVNQKWKDKLMGRESISTTVKEIKNLRIEEASTRAERDKAIELIEELTNEKIQLEEKVRKEKSFEVKVLVDKIEKTIEGKEQEIRALRTALEEKAKFAATVKKQLDETKTNLSNDIKSLNESISVTKQKHQIEADALMEHLHKTDDTHINEMNQWGKVREETKDKHQKELKKLVEAHKVEVKEIKEETEKIVNEQVRKEFITSFVKYRLSETELIVDENSQALLEKCISLDEVDVFLDEILEASRRGALHSESVSSVHISQQKIVDPETAKASRMVGDVFEGMNR